MGSCLCSGFPSTSVSGSSRFRVFLCPVDCARGFVLLRGRHRASGARGAQGQRQRRIAVPDYECHCHGRGGERRRVRRRPEAAGKQAAEPGAGAGGEGSRYHRASESCCCCCVWQWGGGGAIVQSWPLCTFDMDVLPGNRAFVLTDLLVQPSALRVLFPPSRRSHLSRTPCCVLVTVAIPSPRAGSWCGSLKTRG